MHTGNLTGHFAILVTVPGKFLVVLPRVRIVTISPHPGTTLNPLPVRREPSSHEVPDPRYRYGEFLRTKSPPVLGPGTCRGSGDGGNRAVHYLLRLADDLVPT